jgi:hypothetical protein
MIQEAGGGEAGGRYRYIKRAVLQAAAKPAAVPGSREAHPVGRYRHNALEAGRLNKASCCLYCSAQEAPVAPPPPTPHGDGARRDAACVCACVVVWRSEGGREFRRDG